MVVPAPSSEETIQENNLLSEIIKQMSSLFLSISNWRKYQTVTKANPPWIKLHTCIINDYEFSKMDDILKGHFLLLLVLAGKHMNQIPFDSVYIQNEIHAKTPIDYKTLESKGFINIGEKDIYIYNNNINNTEKEIEEEGQIEDLDELVRSIVLDLNEKTGKNYRPNNKETRKLISGRLKENYKVDDFYHIHRVKSDEWLNTEWEQYLRPATLYQKSKFDSYLNQKISAKKDRFTF